MHCVDLGESFPTTIYLQKSASIQPRTSPRSLGENSIQYSFASLGVTLLNEGAVNEPAPSFSKEYCESVGAAFEKKPTSACTFSRQFLLFWLGICIREGSIEAFERFVLASYRMVSSDQEGNFSDEMRASLITFTTETTAEVNVQDRCTEAPLLGFILSLV